MTAYMKKPVLDEDRLNMMTARAARVYKGFSAPSATCAEDVLLLVAELRLVRGQLKVYENHQERSSAWFTNFKKEDAVKRKSFDESIAKTQKEINDLIAGIHETLDDAEARAAKPKETKVSSLRRFVRELF